MVRLEDNTDPEVQVKEQGTLKIDSQAVTLATSGDVYTYNATVPTGKKWKLKGYTLYTSGGSANTYRVSIYNDLGTLNIMIYSSDTAVTIASGFPNDNIELPAGWRVKLMMTATADNTGARSQLLYQEFDA